MNGKAREAWEVYLKMEGTQESFAMLQLSPTTATAPAPSCTRQSFDTLERLDQAEYWDGSAARASASSSR